MQQFRGLETGCICIYEYQFGPSSGVSLWAVERTEPGVGYPEASSSQSRLTRVCGSVQGQFSLFLNTSIIFSLWLPLSEEKAYLLDVDTDCSIVTWHLGSAFLIVQRTEFTPVLTSLSRVWLPVHCVTGTDLSVKMLLGNSTPKCWLLWSSDNHNRMHCVWLSGVVGGV